MSLDVYLKGESITQPERRAIFVRRDGQNVEVTREEWDAENPDREPITMLIGGETSELYSANITHNLNKMADAAGIYKHLWRPDEIGVTKAEQLVGPLTLGLAKLRDEPAYFKTFNPPNGWGDYEGLLSFVTNYLAACIQYPDAKVRVSR